MADDNSTCDSIAADTQIALFTMYARWRGGATGIALVFRSIGREFKSYSKQHCVTTLGKLFTCVFDTKQYNLLLCIGQRAVNR